MTSDAGGRFFEDFTLGEKITHATPRTLESGDIALYQALYGGRHILNSSLPAAQAAGYAPTLENWLVFHIVFGKTVPDISRNAIANGAMPVGFWLLSLPATRCRPFRSDVAEKRMAKAALSWSAAVANQHGNDCRICVGDGQ